MVSSGDSTGKKETTVEGLMEEVTNQDAGTKSDDKQPAVSSSDDKVNIEEKKTELASKFLEGKKSYFANELQRACELLGDAARLSDEIHGELSAASFEPVFYLGRALLDLARDHDKVLEKAMSGMPMPKTAASGEKQGEGEEAVKQVDNSIDEEQYENPDNVTEEERAEIREKVEEALATDVEEAKRLIEEEGKDKPTDAVEGEKKEKGESTQDNGNGNEGEGEETAEEDEEMEDEDAEDGEDDENEQAITTLMEDAWEMLEAARAICDKFLGNANTKADEEEWQHRKISVLQFLADCSIEDENYEQALSDLNKCLEMQKTLLKDFASNRFVAQTYFSMARSHKLDYKFDEAARFYGLAKETLQKRITEAEKELNESSASLEAAVREQLENDVADLKALIPDIDLKIQDTHESSKQYEKMKEIGKEAAVAFNEVYGLLKPGQEDAAGASSSKPVNDISMAIRKPAKRPASADDKTDEGEVKKAKEDENNAAEKEGHVSPAPEA